MLFDTLRVMGFRSIADSGTLELGPVTVVVGRNNSGKSSLLRAVYSIQNGSLFQPSDIRIGENQAQIDLTFPKLPRVFYSNPVLSKLADDGRDGPGTVVCARRRGDPSWSILARIGETTANVSGLASQEPNNLIFPILSGRRVTIYREQASERSALEVSAADNNLVSLE
jgi:AAA ATPase domain